MSYKQKVQTEEKNLMEYAPYLIRKHGEFRSTNHNIFIKESSINENELANPPTTLSIYCIHISFWNDSCHSWIDQCKMDKQLTTNKSYNEFFSFNTYSSNNLITCINNTYDSQPAHTGSLSPRTKDMLIFMLNK